MPDFLSIIFLGLAILNLLVWLFVGLDYIFRWRNESIEINCTEKSNDEEFNDKTFVLFCDNLDEYNQTIRFHDKLNLSNTLFATPEKIERIKKHPVPDEEFTFIFSGHYLDNKTMSECEDEIKNLVDKGVDVLSYTNPNSESNLRKLG